MLKWEQMHEYQNYCVRFISELERIEEGGDAE
jgi:hypothetical protein